MVSVLSMPQVAFGDGVRLGYRAGALGAFRLMFGIILLVLLVIWIIKKIIK